MQKKQTLMCCIQTGDTSDNDTNERGNGMKERHIKRDKNIEARVRHYLERFTVEELEIYAERAAIREYCGGIPRKKAEWEAVKDVLQHRRRKNAA